MSKVSLGADCVVLAVPHGGLSEAIRGLLATAFASVVMVADEHALASCVARLRPALVVLDLAIVRGGGLALLARLHASHPGQRTFVLAGEDDPGLRRAALAAGANRVLLKRSLGTELMPAVDELLADGEATN